MTRPAMLLVALVQAVVTAGWLLYARFQPRILAHFGFVHLDGALSVWLALAGTTLAPLAGAAADGVARRGGARTRVVAVGGLLAGATFVAVALATGISPASPARWIVPVLVLLWIGAMAIFQAPALSLVVADPTRGVSPLVVATGLTAAVWPWLSVRIDDLGGAGAFVVAGAAVLAATWLVVRAMPLPPTATPVPADGSVRPLGLVAALAAGTTSALVTLLAAGIPATLARRIGAVDADVLGGLTFAATALLATPLDGLRARIGNAGGVVASGLVALGAGLGAQLATGGAETALVVLAVGAATALHLDAALPLAFGVMRPRRAGLAAGVYLGGAALGSQLARLVLV